MNKLFLALAATCAAILTFDASARIYKKHCATNTCETTSCAPCEKTCDSECVRVEEEPCPKAPCCVKTVEVRKPARKVKHVYYTWECPSDCQPGAVEIHPGEMYNSMTHEITKVGAEMGE